MTAQATVNPQLPPAPRSGQTAALLAWFRRITQPHPDLTDPEDRRKAQLLAPLSFALFVMLTLAGFISIFTSVFFPDPSVSLGVPGTVLIFISGAGFFVTYRYSTTPQFRIGAWVSIFIVDVFVVGFMLLYRQYSSTLPLGFAVPVLFATIFLSVSGTLRVFAGTMVLGLVMLLIGVLRQDVPVVVFAVTFAIILVVTLLTVLVALLRDEDLLQVKRLRELEAAEGERLRRELELARKVQQSMLPKELPQIPNLELAAYSQPAFEASGDFYDVFYLNHDQKTKVGIVVCDVAGKGVSSALVMSATRAALRAEAERTESPAAVLRKVNDVLASSIPSGLFVTIFYGIYDPSACELRFASAGHPHPYWWTGEEISELENFGMPLGLVAESEYEDQITHLKQGQTVFIYTDGLIEALNPRREMFGFEAVEKNVAQHSQQQASADELVQRTLHEMETFVEGERQHDDVTIVALRVINPEAA
ncbi:MAG: SpoIIE family protein phosphatase [bacterium]|nr:SpoIIE family protein phosphatase [bacterium]